MPASVERSVERRLAAGTLVLAEAFPAAARTQPAGTPSTEAHSEPAVDTADPETRVDRAIRHASMVLGSGNRELRHNPAYPQGHIDRQAASFGSLGPSPVSAAPTSEPTNSVYPRSAEVEPAFTAGRISPLTTEPSPLASSAASPVLPGMTANGASGEGTPDRTHGNRLPTETVYTVTFGARLVSPNAHELPMARHRRVKAEREQTAWALTAHRVPCSQPHTIRLTRLGAGRMDSDNLIAAFKAIRDAVAKHCGFDDRNPTVHWVYGQRYARHPAIIIECEWRTPC